MRILKYISFFKKYSRIIILSIPLIIILYVGINIYQTLTYNKEYYIDLKEDNINNEKIPLYIEDPKYTNLSTIKFYNNEIYRSILKSPISFILKSGDFLGGKKIMVTAMLKGNTNMQLSLQCPNCDNIDSYNNFFDAEMSNKNLAANFGEIYIYAKENKNWKKTNSIQEWIKHNIPTGSSIKIVDKAISNYNFIKADISYINDSNTKLKTIIKGSQSFYVYLDKKIDLNIEKTVLGKKTNKEDYKITLTDLSDKIAWRSYIPADSPYQDSGGYSYESALEKSGIYRLSFDNPLDINFLLENIGINSNKIVFDKSASLKLPVDIYTEIPEERFISFTNLSDTSDNNITIRDEKGLITSKITIKPKELKKIKLTKGKYSVQMTGNGFTKVEAENFAMDKDQYFQPFPYIFDQKKNNSFIISKYNHNINNGWITATNTIDGDRLKQLKNKNHLRFSLLSEYENLVDGKNSTLAKDVTLPEDFKNISHTMLNMNLRGDHEFYVLLDDFLDATIYKQDLNSYDGSDEVSVSLNKTNGYKVCETIISDDGLIGKQGLKNSPVITAKFNCNSLESGVYILSFNELGDTKKDYLIKGLNINTNKIIFKDSVLNITPIKLYTNNTEKKLLNLTYFHSNYYQNIKFSSKEELKTVILSKKDISSKVYHTNPANLVEITPEKGYLSIAGSNFAADPEHWFDPEKFKSIGYIFLKNIKVQIY